MVESHGGTNLNQDVWVDMRMRLPLLVGESPLGTDVNYGRAARAHIIHDFVGNWLRCGFRAGRYDWLKTA